MILVRKGGPLQKGGSKKPSSVSMSIPLMSTRTFTSPEVASQFLMSGPHHLTGSCPIRGAEKASRILAASPITTNSFSLSYPRLLGRIILSEFVTESKCPRLVLRRKLQDVLHLQAFFNFLNLGQQPPYKTQSKGRQFPARSGFAGTRSRNLMDLDRPFAITYLEIS